VTIFVDAMGGDRAPGVVLRGVQLLRKEVDCNLVLLGDQSKLNPFLKSRKLSDLKVIHCPETIEMADSAVQAVRNKTQSSIVQGLQLVASTPRSAFFSAGHSGAVAAAALLTLKRISGVERPAIATTIPHATGQFILLDAGANVDCRPSMLAEFARMGTIYARSHFGKQKIRVGLLSNGEEPSKGTELTRAAFELMTKLEGIDFHGYVEGKTIFDGVVDVVVTDGFTGNLVLKSLEGLAKTITGLFQSELKKNPLAGLGALLISPFIAPSLLRLKRKLDPSEVGSAPLLGVDGLCFIGHGSSSAKAIKNGILRAHEAIESNLHFSMRQEFGR
jgi:glycerol-3-phosphate acyltransferase PlsX